MNRKEVDKNKVTPMMRQYLEIKEENEDLVVFFRLGDFYEMFFDDAEKISRELELTLTGKSCGLEERVPMCGIPYHAASNYIDKLIEKGYKIGICEQLEDPRGVKGIVKSIRPYGVFIEIGGGIVGLLHIEDISVARIKSPFERLNIGQNIKVVVKYIDSEQKRVTLSYKEILGTWEENAKNFQVGSTVVGKVRETEKGKNGIFIELTPNLVGLAEYKEGIEYGQDVDVYIKNIIPEKKKVKLIIV